MRKTCLFCSSKHIAQAIVLCMEAPLGYPLHIWLAVGHLAEAEAELLTDYPAMAERVRAVRVKLMGQEEGFEQLSLMQLLADVREIASNVSGMTDEVFVHKVLFHKE